jgi:hypothetical protein
MAHKRHMAQGEGLRLTFTPENPQVGESIFFQATVTDLGSSGQERLSARIVSPTGQAERLELSPVSGGWGVYRASFTPQESGKFKITVSGEKSGGKLETDVMVSKPQREKLGQPANGAALREIADLTRGASGTVGDLDRLVKQISLLPASEPMEQRFRLWSDPWWGGFLVALLGLYWTARKVAGMI